MARGAPGALASALAPEAEDRWVAWAQAAMAAHRVDATMATLVVTSGATAGSGVMMSSRAGGTIATETTIGTITTGVAAEIGTATTTGVATTRPSTTS